MDWEFICPKGWEIISRWGDGFALRQKEGGLRVVVDCEEKEDGNKWIHVSVSRKNWNPTHGDLVRVKEDFIGPDRYAYFIFPPKDKYVNIHKFCLHLWAKYDTEDGRVLPEFSAVLDVIGRSI